MRVSRKSLDAFWKRNIGTFYYTHTINTRFADVLRFIVCTYTVFKFKINYENYVL